MGVSKIETSEVQSAHLNHEADPNQGDTRREHKRKRDLKHEADTDQGDSRREHKRKRRHKEDASKRRHKDRHTGKHRHHHCSKYPAKEKTKERGSRWKGRENAEAMSSETDSSASHKGSKRSGRFHNRCCGHGADRPEEQWRKRSRRDNELVCVNDNRHSFARNDRTRPPVEVCSPKVKGHHAPSLKDGHVSRTQEQDKDFNVCQRGLVSSVKHQNTSCKLHEHEDRVTSGSPVTSKNMAEVSERAVTDVGSQQASCLLAASEGVDEGAPKDEHWLTLPPDTVLPVQCKHALEGSACDCNCMVEEGEINSETVQSFKEKKGEIENSSSFVKKDESGRLEQEHWPPSQADLAGKASAVTKEESQKFKELGPNVGPAAATGHENSTEFQKKTMSVKRGGETVQATYNVYIPKGALERARRRLQR